MSSRSQPRAARGASSSPARARSHGPQPLDVDRVTEDAFDPGAGEAPQVSAYGEAKRVSEVLLQEFAPRARAGLASSRAASPSSGPDCRSTAGYAVGDFLGDALRGQAVRVAGDGTPLRSYLHAADLAAWLLTILMRGRSCVPYNVGSDAAVSVGSLAARVAALVDPPLPVLIGETPVPRSIARTLRTLDRSRA